MHYPEYRNNNPRFVDTFLTVWKLFNVNSPFKGIRFYDNFSRPLTLNDERFLFLTYVDFWLDALQTLPEKIDKLSKQTYTSFTHACIDFTQITNHLTQSCAFTYVLSSFLQTNALEHHFELYRMMF